MGLVCLIGSGMELAAHHVRLPHNLGIDLVNVEE